MTLWESTSAEYTGQTFKGFDLSGREIRGKTFVECRFARSRLREARLTGCTFHDCAFVECDLSLIDVTDSAFRTVRFENSQVIGVNWTLAVWGRAGVLNSIGFARCAISYSTFIGLCLPGLAIESCTARDVDFAEADLSKASFRGTDLLESRFLHTNLTGADFTGASNYAIDATLNTLKKTRFSLPEAMSLLYSLDIILDNGATSEDI
jgi:uncharacterized protein YjbI with pentapeptide repeats